MVNDTQCPVCFNGSLEDHDLEFLTCTTCDEKFNVFDSVPYLGRFYEDDLFSVMETTSILSQIHLDENLSTYGNEPPEQLTIGYLEIQKVLDLSKDEIGSNINFADFGYDEKPSWFSARFNELQQFREVMGGADLNDKRVLDVGAGTGFDSLRFLSMGANVTALEYNPLQASYAAKAIPNIDWLGGSATHIPFKNETFDFVIANAALHHIKDLETAINEMLRVLKPGGTMITLADSFSPFNFSEDQEVHVFENHPAVLRGVNEQLPNLNKYIDPLIAQGDTLKVELFTPIVHGLHKRSAKLRRWSLDDATTALSNYRGGLCMKVNKLKPTHYKRKNQKKVLVEFSDYISQFASRADALVALCKHVPKYAIDLDFHAPTHQKLKLLMGWKPFSESDNYQTGVSDGYLFCSRKYIKKKLSSFFIAVPHAAKCSPRQIRIFLNGTPIYHVNIDDPIWKKIDIDITSFNQHVNGINLVHISINQLEGGVDLNSFFIRTKQSHFKLIKQILKKFTGCL